MKETTRKTLNFIQKFNKILENYKEFLKKKEEYGFNIFSVSTYTSYLENFHSDVLYSLLSQNGLHNEGVLFIEKFFEYLRNLNIGISDILNIDFNKVKVYKEIGDKQSRIDILITYNEKNDNKTKAIIFENKINNAPDQNKQLERYYNWCEKQEYEVVSILYASLDGYKTAPKTKMDKIDNLVKNISFFNNANKDMVNGWLLKCKPKSEDTKSFLNQYIKLLKFLGVNTMNKENMEKFYNEAGNKETQEKLQLINELNNNLLVFRTEKFFERYKNNIEPFKKIDIKYCQGCVELIDFFIEEENFQIEIDFTDNNQTNLVVWPRNNSNKGIEILSNVVKNINLKDDKINYEYDNVHKFSFNINNYKTLESIDVALYDFTKEIFEKLKKI